MNYQKEERFPSPAEEISLVLQVPEGVLHLHSFLPTPSHTKPVNELFMSLSSKCCERNFHRRCLKRGQMVGAQKK